MIYEFLLNAAMDDSTVDKTTDDWMSTTRETSKDLFNTLKGERYSEVRFTKGMNSVTFQDKECFTEINNIEPIEMIKCISDISKDPIVNLLKVLSSQIGLSMPGELIECEDKLNELMSQLEAYQVHEKILSEIKSMIPSVAGQEDFIVTKMLPNGLPLKEILSDKNIVEMEVENVMSVVQNIITEDIENGELEPEHRGPVTQSIYGGQNPFQIGNKMKLVCVHKDKTIRLELEDIQRNDIANLIIDEILNEITRGLQSTPIEKVEGGMIKENTDLESTGDNNLLLIDNSQDYIDYERCKDRLTLFNVDWNDFSEDIIIVYDGSHGRDDGDLHINILESVKTDNKGISKFRKGAVLQYIIKTISDRESFLTQDVEMSIDKIAEDTFKILIDRNLIVVKPSITIRNNGKFVNLVSNSSFKVINSLDPLTFQKQINDK